MQMAAVDELACVTLEDTLTVSKPTISYHTKILYHAGLISVRKSGRNYYYSLRRDVLHELLDDLRELASTPRPVIREEDGHVATGRRQKWEAHALSTPARKHRGAIQGADFASGKGLAIVEDVVADVIAIRPHAQLGIIVELRGAVAKRISIVGAGRIGGG